MPELGWELFLFRPGPAAPPRSHLFAFKVVWDKIDIEIDDIDIKTPIYFVWLGLGPICDVNAYGEPALISKAIESITI
jgi:hypothetical protein